MVNRFLKVLLFGAAMLVGLNPVFADDNKYVIARVGDVDITVFELQRQSQRIMPFNKTFHGGVSKEKMHEIRMMAFETLVEQAYKVNYAQRNNILAPEDRVQKKIDAVVAKVGGQEQLMKVLRDESYESFKASVERLLVSEEAEEIAVKSKIDIGDEELLTFYRANTFMYQRPKKYRASHILIRVDPSLVGEERQKLISKAEKLAEQAKSGEDFYNLAYYNSDEDTKFVGGDIGYFQSGQTVKEFEDAVKELEPGDIVGPVETISGFHVIQLTDIQDARLLDFDEVKGKIKKTLEDKQYGQRYSEWISELERTVEIVIFHPELKSYDQ